MTTKHHGQSIGTRQIQGAENATSV